MTDVRRLGQLFFTKVLVFKLGGRKTEHVEAHNDVVTEKVGDLRGLPNSQGIENVKSGGHFQPVEKLKYSHQPIEPGH